MHFGGKMKIIALTPVKNEEPHLPAFLQSISRICDEAIIIDDGSTDGSVEIIQKFERPDFKIQVYPSSNEEEWTVDKIRQDLLNKGRESNGTHFICLDGDECFTEQFHPIAKKIMARMEKGHKIQMQWLAMWKSVDHYRDDRSVWSNNYKDFIFCDDKVSNFPSHAYFCDPRTPGENKEENTLKLNPKYGAVMHFQFSYWKRFQIKQCWYRCRELAYGKPPSAINQKFAITLDDPNAIVTACPSQWIPSCLSDKSLEINNKNDWHLEEIKYLFNKHGVEKFKDLNIWHVKEIEDLKNGL